MAAKDLNSFLNDRKQAFVNDSDINDRFSNLNVNQNNQSSFPVPVQSTDKSNKSQTYDSTPLDNSEEKRQVHAWNKSSKISTFTTANNEDEKPCWKKNSSSSNTNNTTVSPYNPFYENLFEEKSDSNASKKEGLAKTWKSAKPVFGSPSMMENPFKFTQQQESGETKTPENTLYKASQHLLNAKNVHFCSSSCSNDFIVNNRYCCQTKRIGSTPNNDIFLFIDIQTGAELAGKIEYPEQHRSRLHYEAKFYKLLGEGIGIPKMFYVGPHSTCNILIMDRLGPSLENLFQKCHHKFSVSTATNLAIQFIDRLEFIHSKSVLHQDIKPANFVMGYGKNDGILYAIDFGHSKEYQCPNTKEHIPFIEEDPRFLINHCYLSLKCHENSPKSRRDDMEAVAYMLIQFLRGNLPWEKLDHVDRILEKKLEYSPEVLCEKFPPEFAKFLTYCRGLGFEEKPDYAFIKNMFLKLREKSGGQTNFDWDEI